ncbi:MAG TPA: hypothetical protein VKC90_12310 [Chitinophagaceae bacterium]|nr:hypothetical protein [Chitinophagaceae bacterium]
MEVHQHTHTERKKWHHYFWEFLMLFFAVTLGFFVENQREHMAEHQREKQFMQSMLEDLKSDTAQFASNSISRHNRIEKIDSLIFLLSSSGYKANGNAVYYFARSISPPLNFFPNDRTIQQLKSSGGLRLIRNVEVSNSIMAYDQKMRFLLFELTDEIEVRSEYRQLARDLFNGKVFNSMLENNMINRPLNNPPLFNENATLINALIGEAQYIKKIDLNQVSRTAELKKHAAELIAMIKKEYHLK